MTKPCNRLAKLVLEYLGEDERILVTGFSKYLRQLKADPTTPPIFSIPDETLRAVLGMVFENRHSLKVAMKEPDWDKMEFFVGYQLNLRGQDNFLIGAMLEGVSEEDRKAIIREMVRTGEKRLEEKFFNPPAPASHWSQPALVEGQKPQLSNRPVDVRKPLPKITHNFPLTLQ